MADLETLVRELLALDPSLREREAQVRSVVAAMLAGRPDTGFRPEFRDELRARLDAEIVRRSRPSLLARAGQILWPMFVGAAATAFVAAAVLRPDLLSRGTDRPAGSPDRPLAAGPSVTKREPGAFGPLAFLAPRPEAAANLSRTMEKPQSLPEGVVPAPAPEASQKVSAPSVAAVVLAPVEVPSAQDGAGQGPAPIALMALPPRAAKAAADSPSPATEGLSVGAASSVADATAASVAAPRAEEGSSAAIPEEDYSAPLFSSGNAVAGSGGVVALGAPETAARPALRRVVPRLPPSPRFVFSGTLDLASGPVAVYRRLPSAPVPRRLLDAAGIPADAASRLTSFSFALSSPAVLQVSVDLAGGTVSAYRDWARWPQCPPQGCAPVAPSDVPPDEAFLSGAADALAAMGLSAADYGVPSVDRSGLSAGSVPDVLTVRYPVLFSGLPLYDESGVARSVAVDMDVRTTRAVAVNGADFAAWEASDYPSVPAAVAAARARSGGLGFSAPAGRPVDVALGAPVRGYVEISVPSDAGTSATYRVPALVFSVPAAPENLSVPTAVVVPLADVGAPN